LGISIEGCHDGDRLTFGKDTGGGVSPID